MREFDVISFSTAIFARRQFGSLPGELSPAPGVISLSAAISACEKGRQQLELVHGICGLGLAPDIYSVPPYIELMRTPRA
eukprot:3090690-Karenia_brevis.AAC.1